MIPKGCGTLIAACLIGTCKPGDSEDMKAIHGYCLMAAIVGTGWAGAAVHADVTGVVAPLVLAQEAATEAPNETPKEDGAAEARAAWEKRETDLLNLVTIVSRMYVKANNRDDEETDFEAVKANVKTMIYEHAGTKGDIVWPETQYTWARMAHEALANDEKHDRQGFAQQHELALLGKIQEALIAKGQEKDEAQAEVAGEDDKVWKFRDKSGARTTKPRYKGQEPLN